MSDEVGDGGSGGLRTILDSVIDVAVVAADADGLITYWSAGAQRVLGWTAEEMCGQPMAQLFSEEDRAAGQPEAEMRAAAADGRAADERWHLRRDRTRFWASGELFPVRSQPGAEVGGVVKMLRDRTQARRDWDALLELASRLERMQDVAEMSFVAAEILGRTLGVSSTGYGRMTEDGLYFEMERDWTAPGVTGVGGRLRVEEYGSFYDQLRIGVTVAIADVRLDPRTAESTATLEAISARAFVNLPLIEQGRLVALFYVLSASPYAWSDSDLAFIRQVAERTRAAVERRRAEAALRALATSLERQVEERTRERDQVWQASRDLLCVATLDGWLVNLNPAWQATLGWTREELTGRPFIDFVHPDDVDATIRAAAGLGNGEAQLGFENRYRRRDGSYRWLSWNAVPRNGLIFATVRDVTVERSQDEELRRSRATLKTLFETSYQLQALLSLDGTVLDANAVSLSAIGCELGDVAGKAYWETPWFCGTPAVVGQVRDAVAAAGAGESGQMSITVELASGRRSYDFTIRPLRDETGAIVAIVPEAVDITERIEAEEKLRQSQKMEAVGQLTGGLAHDFNNLLTGITGSLELLQTRMTQGRVTDVDRYITAAQGAARRAAALTHRLLAFSRRQTLDPKPVNVNRLVAGMEELIRRTVGPEIAVEAVASASLWNTLIDASQLENALLNLCINARDALPDGGRVTVETGNVWLDERSARDRDLTAGQYVSLCVSDNGTGMSADTVARAFDPFFTTKPIGQGTGLGLSMIYGFVRQSGGQVRIYSEVGKGTVVCLYLPRHVGPTDEGQEAAELLAAPRARRGETVLVVDDEPTVRMLVAEVLEDLGYTAIEAADGAAGLKVLQSDARIDLLVTDVGLPGGMNGRQLADAARVERPQMRVLFITGYAENAVINHGHLEPGMQVLTKPFALESLASRIKELIADR